MTVSSPTIYDADYYPCGNLNVFRISAVFTPGGVASTEILIPHPVSGTADNTNSTWSCAAAEGSTAVADPRWQYNGTYFRVFKPAGANWTLGTVTVQVFGAYRQK